MANILTELQQVLQKKGGGVNLDCDYIGLYFSAHWCPPCRAFTPQLADYYQAWKADGKGKTLEIIFISLDQDENAFNDYFATMPWAALKFSEKETQGKSLSQKFGVRGIPTLVILDKNGETVTLNGRGQVGQNASQAKFEFQKDESS